MSLTITSLAVAVLGFILQHAGIVIGTESLTNFVDVGLQIIGAVGIYWGRFRQGDINVFGRKRQGFPLL